MVNGQAHQHTGTLQTMSGGLSDFMQWKLRNKIQVDIGGGVMVDKVDWLVPTGPHLFEHPDWPKQNHKLVEGDILYNHNDRRCIITNEQSVFDPVANRYKIVVNLTAIDNLERFTLEFAN